MLRFSIRDVLWLTVVVALAAAWFADRINIRRDCAARIAAAHSETDTLHDDYADLMAAIHDAGVRAFKRPNGSYTIRFVQGRPTDPALQPAGAAPFQR